MRVFVRKKYLGSRVVDETEVEPGVKRDYTGDADNLDIVGVRIELVGKSVIVSDEGLTVLNGGVVEHSHVLK